MSPMLRCCCHEGLAGQALRRDWVGGSSCNGRSLHLAKQPPMSAYRIAGLLPPQFIHSTYPLDDADLALIEINTSSPLVMRLVEEVRRLRDAEVFRLADEAVSNDRSYNNGYDDGFEEGKLGDR